MQKRLSSVVGAKMGAILPVEVNGLSIVLPLPVDIELPAFLPMPTFPLPVVLIKELYPMAMLLSPVLTPELVLSAALPIAMHLLAVEL